MEYKVAKRYAAGGLKVTLGSAGIAFGVASAIDVLFLGADVTGEIFGHDFESALDGSATRSTEVIVVSHDISTGETSSSRVELLPTQTEAQYLVTKYGYAAMGALLAATGVIASDAGRKDLMIADLMNRRKLTGS